MHAWHLFVVVEDLNSASRFLASSFYTIRSLWASHGHYKVIHKYFTFFFCFRKNCSPIIFAVRIISVNKESECRWHVANFELMFLEPCFSCVSSFLLKGIIESSIHSSLGLPVSMWPAGLICTESGERDRGKEREGERWGGREEGREKEREREFCWLNLPTFLSLSYERERGIVDAAVWRTVPPSLLQWDGRTIHSKT